MAVIEVRGLTRIFEGDVRAVDGIDFTVEDGEIFGFIGPNGAGKSTTVHILTTLLLATAGEARIAGFDVEREPQQVRKLIGVALQEAGLDRYATGREVLELQARLYGLDGSRAARRAAELIEMVRLDDAADRLVRTYSGGMKRRLDLASAMVHRPSVLFLDEPTTGLDPASRHDIWGEVRRLNRDLGCTIFLTTHYLEEVDRLADRVAIIDRGRIVAAGSPGELKARISREVVHLSLPIDQRAAALDALASAPGVTALTTSDTGLSLAGADPIRALSRALQTLDAAGIEVDSVSMERPTLDDVYLSATGRPIDTGERCATAAVNA